MPTLECAVCCGKKHGMFTSSCGHEFCGKCFLRLHVDAALDLYVTSLPQKKSKCPFCRQVLGHEDSDYRKIVLAHRTESTLHEKNIKLRLELKKETKRLASLTYWCRRMRKLNHKLKIEMNF